MIPPLFTLYGLKWRLEQFSWNIERWRSDVAFWFVKRLPRWVRYYTVVSAAAEATTGQYSDTVVPELTTTELIQRMPR